MPLGRREFRSRLYSALTELATIVEDPERLSAVPSVSDIVYSHTASGLEDGVTMADRSDTAAPERTVEVIPVSAGAIR